MANDCSRKCNLTNDELLTYFNLKYPKQVLWQTIHLRPEINSVLNLDLLQRRYPPESYLPTIKRQERLGTSGVKFSNKLMQTQNFWRWPILSHYPKPLASVSAMDESHPVEELTELSRLRMQFSLSSRNFSIWGPQTLV